MHRPLEGRCASRIKHNQIGPATFLRGAFPFPHERASSERTISSSCAEISSFVSARSQIVQNLARRQAAIERVEVNPRRSRLEELHTLSRGMLDADRAHP